MAEILNGFHHDDLLKKNPPSCDLLVHPSITMLVLPPHFLIERTHAHQLKIPHLTVSTFAYTRDGRFCLQKRSVTRETNPGKWTDSASGHVAYAPILTYDYIVAEMEREVFEEIGVKPISIDHGEMFMHNIMDGGCELAVVFFITIPETICIDLSECDAASGLKTREEMQRILQNEPFTPYTKDIWKRVLQRVT